MKKQSLNPEADVYRVELIFEVSDPIGTAIKAFHTVFLQRWTHLLSWHIQKTGKKVKEVALQ